MAGEFVHASVGGALTQAEWESITAHVLNDQAQGDIVIANSTTNLKRLAAGTAGQVLQTGGAGADPTWATPAIANGITITYPATGGRIPKVITKAADETVNNSTSYQDDDELILPVLANEQWFIICAVRSISSNTADIKLQWTLPAGAVWRGDRRFWNESSVAQNHPHLDLTSGTAMAGQVSASFSGVHYIGILTVAGTAGDVALQWAQNTLEASNTVVKASSCILAWKLN